MGTEARTSYQTRLFGHDQPETGFDHLGFPLENTSNFGKKERLHLVWDRALAHRALGMSMAEDEQLQEAIAYI